MAKAVTAAATKTDTKNLKGKCWNRAGFVPNETGAVPQCGQACSFSGYSLPQLEQVGMIGFAE
jgi:hypothetical protein